MQEHEKFFEKVAHYFALLAEPMRVRILHTICHEEKTVQQIVDTLDATQTNVSRHLGLMYRAGVLARRKDGNFVLYRVSDPTLIELCRTVCLHLARQSGKPASQTADLVARLTRQWTLSYPRG